MTNRKRLYNIFAFIVLAAFAVACVFCVSACGSDYDDMTDYDAVALYAALVKTDEYEGSFTVVNTMTESYGGSETYDDEKNSYSGEEVAKYTTSYDADSGYLVYKYDQSDSWEEDGESETYLYSRYRYYVPGENGTITQYTYLYELDGDGEQERKAKEDATDSNFYASHTNLPRNTDIANYYGETEWTSVEDLKNYFLDGEDGAVEIGKEKKDTVYRISATFEFEEGDIYDGERYSYEDERTVIFKFQVNSEGYVTKYSIEENMSEKGSASTGYSELTRTYTVEYEISYSFDEKLKLAEKEMADYVEE